MDRPPHHMEQTTRILAPSTFIRQRVPHRALDSVTTNSEGHDPRQRSRSVRAHLAIECNRRLVEPLLLGVADVGRDDLVEGEVLVAIAELRAVLLGLNSKLAANGVLGSNDVLVDVIGGESHFRGKLTTLLRRRMAGCCRWWGENEGSKSV